MEQKNKCLILVPAVTARGGITNYYQVLKKEFPENIEYFERGARTWPVRKGFFSELLRARKDFGVFKKKIKQDKISLVQSSTSLGFASVIRDGLFLSYARRKGLKTIVFFRGWDEHVQKTMEKKYLWLFKHFFFSCNRIIVLSEKVKNQLLKWGYKNDIDVETTTVDKLMVLGLTEEKLKHKFDEAITKRSFNILFLSRVERRKGIYELLDAFDSVNRIAGDEFKINLKICGDGFELDKIRETIREKSIDNVEVKGFVEGDAKKAAFDQAHLFVFPSHGEGMPNAVLEAMGFGLPVITTPVGGVVDFFNDPLHGYYIGIDKTEELTNKLKEILFNPEKMKEISFTNYTLADSKFRSDKVAERIIKIFEKTLMN